MILPITLTIAAALTLLNVGLALHVVRRRFGGRIMNGTGGDEAMEARTRAQANLVEYAPFFLILLALVELAGASPTWLWVAGALFVLLRLSHAFGMLRPPPSRRCAGNLGSPAAARRLGAGHRLCRPSGWRAADDRPDQPARLISADREKAAAPFSATASGAGPNLNEGSAQPS